MTPIAGLIISSMITDIVQHKHEVRTVSIQNAGCIYLESSKLGDGQHYMICDGEITLKRINEEEQIDAEKALEEVLPTEPATATTPSPSPTT